MALPTSQDVRAKIVDDDGVVIGTADNPLIAVGEAQYLSSGPTHVSGDFGTPRMNQRGLMYAAIAAANGTEVNANALINLTVASVTGGGALEVAGFNLLFDGTRWVKQAMAGSAARLPSAAATVNATAAKAAAGVLKQVNGYNARAGVVYLKLYNKATAPTVGTDTPFMTLALPPSAAFNFDLGDGVYFSAGISYGLTTDAADAGTTAVAAGDVLGLNLLYA